MAAHAILIVLAMAASPTPSCATLSACMAAYERAACQRYGDLMPRHLPAEYRAIRQLEHLAKVRNCPVRTPYPCEGDALTPAVAVATAVCESLTDTPLSPHP